MFDFKMLLIILAIVIVIFGSKRLRTIGTDLGAAVKGVRDGFRGTDDDRKSTVRTEPSAHEPLEHNPDRSGVAKD